MKFEKEFAQLLFRNAVIFIDSAIGYINKGLDNYVNMLQYAQNGFVMLRFENYCADPVELGPDGLPARSSHGGYDLKSVRAAAEAHGGTLTLHWENEWFTVRILLPQK